LSYTIVELRRACREAGCKDIARCVSAIELQVSKGTEPQEALRLLHKWQPALFYGGRK